MNPGPAGALPGLPGLLGITILTESADLVDAALTVGPQHLAATGYLHAGCVVALADTAWRLRLPGCPPRGRPDSRPCSSPRTT